MASNGGGVWNAVGLLVLRLGAAALLFYGHGWPKITHFAEKARSFSDPLHVGSPISLGLVVFAEVFCSIFVALGLFTRVAALPVVIFLSVAFFIQHGADPWSKREVAAIFGLPFLALLFTGAGGFSLDALIFRRKGGKG